MDSSSNLSFIILSSNLIVHDTRPEEPEFSNILWGFGFQFALVHKWLFSNEGC